MQRYHYESHDQLRRHLADFLAAYNFAKRLKALRDLTPHEYVCKIWTENPARFKKDQPTTLRDRTTSEASPQTDESCIISST